MTATFIPPVEPPNASLSGVAEMYAGAFVSSERLGQLTDQASVARIGPVLTAGQARFALVDGLRILGVEPGKTDPYGLTGRVASLVSLLRRGFVLSARRVSLGRHVYDIELGVILEPLNDLEAARIQPVAAAASAPQPKQ